MFVAKGRLEVSFDRQRTTHACTTHVAAGPSVSDPTTPKVAMGTPAILGGALSTTVSKLSTAAAATAAYTHRKIAQLGQPRGRSW